MARLSTVFFFLIALIFPALGFAAAGITYHGRLVKPDSTSVTAPVVQFKIQIRSSGNENCLMYQETHTRDMSGTDGVFAITINDGTASTVNTEPFSLDRVFQNRGTFTFAGGKCGVGNTYTPNPADGRKLFVDFNDGSFGGWESLPAQAINYVPTALESLTVGGYGSGSMLRVHDGTGAPASISALTQTQYNTFTDLLAGTSSLYLTSSSALNGANLSAGSIDDTKLASGITGSKISGNISGNAAGFTGSLGGDVTGTQSATVVGKIQGRAVDSGAPTNGQVLKWNNGSSRWEAAADNAGTGTVTSVTGTGAIQMTGTANDPIVGVRDASTTLKGIVQLASSADSAANLVVQSNDTRLTDSRTPTAHHHGVDEIDSAASKYFSYKPNNTACANGELLKWNLAQTRWECGTASSSEATTASNVGTAGVGVFKTLNTYDLQFKKLNAASNVTLTDDTGNSKIDIAVNLSGVFANNTGLVVSDGTQLQNKACSANEILKWLSPSGWTCSSAYVASETDPKVGANTANYLSKWDGSALIASGVFENATGVGIGTNNPAQKFEVYGSSATPMALTRSTSTNGSNIFQAYNALNTSSAEITYARTAGVIGSSTAGAESGMYQIQVLQSGVMNQAALFTPSLAYFSGWVGVGTASPDAPLHNPATTHLGNDVILTRNDSFATASLVVDNSVTTGIALQKTGGGTIGTIDLDATKVYIPSGSLGIGTTNPSEKLEVNGNVKATQLCIGSDCRGSWPSGSGGSLTLSSQGSNFSVLTSDGGKLFVTSATVTASLPSASSAGSGFMVRFKNPVGTLTVNPAGSDMIDSQTTLQMTATNSYVELVSTGTGWLITNKNGTMTLASYQTWLWNPATKDSGITLSNGNTAAQSSCGGTFCYARANTSKSSGKWYFEMKAMASSPSGGTTLFGVQTAAQNTAPGNHGNTSDQCLIYDYNIPGITNGSVVQVAVDISTGKVWFGANGTWLGSGNPSAGTNASCTMNSATTIYPVMWGYGSPWYGRADVNATTSYSPPGGFAVWSN